MASAASDNAREPNAPLETERPAFGTALVPKERYTSRSFAEREWQAMWRRVWLIAGRESDIRNAGDFLTFEIGTESVLVVRQADGEVRAYHNVCRHRGNRLVPAHSGNARRFSCSFHGWCYGLDGALLKALDPHTFPQGDPREHLALAPVRCELWGGFIWVNFAADSEPLSSFLGPVAAQLAPYHLEEWSIDCDVTIEVECNWKTCVDAFNESYHVAHTHPQLLSVSDDVNCPIDFYGRHSRLIFPEVQSSPRHAGRGTVTNEIRETYLRPAGIDVEAVGDDPAAARKALGDAMRAATQSLGGDSASLDDDQMVDNYHFSLFPNVTVTLHALGGWVIRHRPHPDDPNQMFFDFWNVVRQPNQDVPRPEHQTIRYADGKLADRVPAPVPSPEFFRDVLDQDFSNLRTVQQGMRSSAHVGHYLSDQEVRIRHFHEALMGYLEDVP